MDFEQLNKTPGTILSSLEAGLYLGEKQRMPREPGLQEFHLVGENFSIGQGKIFRPIRDVWHGKQGHMGLFRFTVALTRVTTAAGRHHVRPFIFATSGHRDDVVPGQVRFMEITATVHAQVCIAQEQFPIG